MVGLVATISAEINEPIRICAIRVSFAQDDNESTTGDGQFLMENQGIECGKYTIDTAPHDKDYFRSQFVALDAYMQSVSYGKFGINLEESDIFPSENDISFQLSKTMRYYNPFDEYDIQEERLTELFRDALVVSNNEVIDYSLYDLFIVFHAGIGQDFSLPFLDPTPEDIPSTFVDNQMIQDNLNISSIIINGNHISQGIILPETQNHLLFDISESIFSDAADPCEYQYGLTGTFALMVGFAIGLPPLWDISTGESRIGVFGLMDQGSNNARGIIPAPLTAWSRIFSGWEEPLEAGIGDAIALPIRGEGNLVKINIRDDEYYLIENRSNNIRNGISIDSLRYFMSQTSGPSAYPSYIEILLDSTGIERDTNGVVVYVPNYDIGLPASGLLIWHIDDNVISNSIDNYSFNTDISYMGIDLEEADGAQDIGYPSIFLFNDPSAGYFGDMWFRGNTQFNLANPGYDGLDIEFGPNTFPSTKANDGSSTNIRIEQIGMPGDTMRFVISNSFIPSGYPDTTLNISSIFDLDRDGENEIIGGNDSLFIIKTDTMKFKNTFHGLSSNEFLISFVEEPEQTMIHIMEYFQDSCLQSIYEYDMNSNNIGNSSMEWIDSLVYPVMDLDSGFIEWKTSVQWEIHKQRLFSTPYNYGIDIGNRGISVEKFGNTDKKWTNTYFTYLAGVDMDMDGNIEAIALDSSGILYSFNTDLNLMSGFPLDINLKPPILLQNLIGSSEPEIVARSLDNTILYIFDRYGNPKQMIAIESNEKLVALGDYNGKNAIYTSSGVYQFDITEPSYGNKWDFEHGNRGRSRKIMVDYPFNSNESSMLIRSYCYPNPVEDGTGTIRVETVRAKKIKISIYDVGGYFIKDFVKDIIQDGNQISEWVWNVQQLESGIYFAHIDLEGENKNKTDIIKIVVIH